MAAIVYLDADDEITSAASRIRVADDKRIALVVPYGSRLATSRINFRLLAREAQGRGHRLSVVAGDAATRALAASAGLPVFGSVGEYEEAETTRPGHEPEGVSPAAVDTEPPVRRRRPPAGAGATAAAAAPVATAAVQPDGAATQVLEGPATERSAHDSGGRGAAARGGASAGLASAGAATAGTATVAAPGAAAGQRTLRWRGTRVAWPYGQNAAIAVGALVALALLALAVAAYLLLPSASATVALQMERIGPLQMEIRADPEATSPDAESGVIPAQRLSFDVAASGMFPATGVRVEATRARGTVRFISKNPVDENNIGLGAIVSTPNGIQFRTTSRVRIPKATIVGLTVVPGEGTATVEAVEPGIQGNVAAQAITVIPENEDPTFTEVRNPEPTRGGSREEFPLVEQADFDAAIAQLRTQLDTEFAAILADPGRVPPGLTVFGESRVLAEPLPTTDPATVVGQEVAEFPLGLATTGTVIAVDSRPVEEVARERIASSVEAGHRLVDGSVEVAPGEPVVEGETVTFPVTASGAQIRVLDPDAVRKEIQGKPIAEARSLLEQYGAVELSVWPDWVSVIPTIDGRVDVRVVLPAGLDAPSSSPSPASSGSSDPGPDAPSPSPAAPGSASPPAGASSEPSVSLDPGLGGESPPP